MFKYYITKSLHKLNRKLNQIMTTQAEEVVQIQALTAQVGKIAVETQTLLTKIDELTAALAAAGAVDPAVQAALDALQAQVSVVDALVPDA
jgi:hypothetical protein